MRLALDTNRYTDLTHGVADVVVSVQRAEAVYIPFVVLAELRAGFMGGSRGIRNEQALIKFLDETGVQSLFPDAQTTHHYARLYLQLRRQGTPIPSNDLWIAALVIQHGLTLYARDKHFDHLPQLPRL